MFNLFKRIRRTIKADSNGVASPPPMPTMSAAQEPNPNAVLGYGGKSGSFTGSLPSQEAKPARGKGSYDDFTGGAASSAGQTDFAGGGRKATPGSHRR